MASRTPGILGRIIDRITGRGPRARKPVVRVSPPRRPEPLPPVVHKIIGQLQDEKTKTPLPGFTVRVLDLDADERPKNLGYDTTDPDGLFTMVYATSRESGDNPARRLRLQIADRQARQVAQI